MNHPWIKNNVIVEPLPHTLAAKGLANLPSTEQQQQTTDG